MNFFAGEKLEKTFIGSQLRQLRKNVNQTQNEMAAKLGISSAYVNMLEKNQRSLSLKVLVSLSEEYGVDWKDFAQTDTSSIIAELRSALQDPLFENQAPDLDELRSAITHAPNLTGLFLQLYKAHQTATKRLQSVGHSISENKSEQKNPGESTYKFFQENSNYFDEIELVSEQLAKELSYDPFNVHHALVSRLENRLGYKVETLPVEQTGDSLRLWNKEEKEILLSQVLDFKNRNFHLAHMICLIEFPDVIKELTSSYKFPNLEHEIHCQTELANYFAAALLMPYKSFQDQAEKCRYDLDRVAAAHAVSFEQVAQRLTTMQRDNQKGIPFFFLRVDKTGKITKKFNAMSVNIAEQGDSSPVKNIHTSFRTPGVILPQVIELADKQKYVTFCRTTERPVYSVATQDRRLAIAMGCELRYASRIVYADTLSV